MEKAGGDVASKREYALRAVLVLALCLAATAAVAGDTADPWLSRLAAFAEADGAHPPRADVLLVGSSSIALWSGIEARLAPLQVVRRGLGGAGIRDIVERFDRLVKPYTPAVTVLFAGSNDLAPGSTADPGFVVDGIAAFRDRLRRLDPGARLIYISITPTPSRLRAIDAVNAANDRVSRWAAQLGDVYYLDTASAFVGVDGTPDPALFRPDGLHLSPAGYRIWERRLGELLEVLAPAAGT